MSYRIDYQPVGMIGHAQKRSVRVCSLTAILFLLFLLLINLFWPYGRNVLQGLLFSGDPAVTVAALDGLTDELRSGVTLTEALRTFCRFIMTHGN